MTARWFETLARNSLIWPGLVLLLCVGPANAVHDDFDFAAVSRFCNNLAREKARAATSNDRTVGGAVSGGARGSVMGAIFGGPVRSAMIGAVTGAVSGSRADNKEETEIIDREYEACLQRNGF